MQHSVSSTSTSEITVATDGPFASRPFSRRHSQATWLFVLALLGWLIAGVAMECMADSTPPSDGTPSLQVVLEKGLRARRPSEIKFIGRVCDAVTRGDIPDSLAQRTYLWARRKNRYPFPYFQRAMVIQAGKLGVTL